MNLEESAECQQRMRRTRWFLMMGALMLLSTKAFSAQSAFYQDKTVTPARGVISELIEHALEMRWLMGCLIRCEEGHRSF